jgi:hypothetical protein
MNELISLSKSRYSRDFILSGGYGDDSDEAFGLNKGRTKRTKKVNSQK